MICEAARNMKAQGAASIPDAATVVSSLVAIAITTEVDTAVSAVAMVAASVVFEAGEAEVVLAVAFSQYPR